MRSSHLFDNSPSPSASRRNTDGQKQSGGGGYSSCGPSFTASYAGSGGVEIIREEKTAMGEKYVVNELGEKIIPQSKRPDGTYRKSIKVKPGYVPLEEQRSYMTRQQENRLKLAERRSAGPPGWVPAPAPPENNKTKKKKKKKNADVNNNDVSSSSHGDKQNEDVSTELTKQMKNKLNLNDSTEKNTSKNSNQKENELPDVSAQSNLNTATDISKRIRNVRKKLNEIADLEEKQKEGKELSTDQMNKINRKAALEEEIKSLEVTLEEK